MPFHLHFCPAEEIRSHNVLELGSGSGFLGIIVALLQIEHWGDVEGVGGLCLTDVDECVLQQCHRNFQLPRSKSFNSGILLGTKLFTCYRWGIKAPEYTDPSARLE